MTFRNVIVGDVINDFLKFSFDVVEAIFAIFFFFGTHMRRINR
jgi:hypothetical protein